MKKLFLLPVIFTAGLLISCDNPTGGSGLFRPPVSEPALRPAQDLEALHQDLLELLGPWYQASAWSHLNLSFWVPLDMLNNIWQTIGQHEYRKDITSNNGIHPMAGGSLWVTMSVQPTNILFVSIAFNAVSPDLQYIWELWEFVVPRTPWSAWN